MKRTLALALLGAFVLPAYSAAPSINVGAMYEYLGAGKSTLLKRVRNSGDATAFVRVAVTEVVYGADGQPSEMPINTAQLSMRDASSGHTLVASPARLIVSARGQQATRLVYYGVRDQERYYRVRFVPAVPEKMDEFALSDEESVKYQKELSAGLQVLTGYGVFVIVQPDEVRYDTQLQDEADSYTVRNNGNSTIVVDDFYDCPSADKDCFSSPRKIHVLPQRSQNFIKVAGHQYRFELIEGDRQRPIRFGS